MKTKDLCMLFAGLFLVGCSADEEIANVSTSESNAISFNVVSNNPQTKATIINNSTDLQQYPFKVYAFRNGTAYGDKDGIEIKYNDSKWDYEDPSKLLYWPHVDSVDFYAVSPSGRDSHYRCLIQSDSQTLSYYFASDEYGNPSYEDENGNPVPHIDVMYAIAKRQHKADNNGIVTLPFKHALSQVVFKAKKNDPLMHVKVNKMVLHYVQSVGTFQFPTDDETDGQWTHTSGFRSHANYTVGFSQAAPLTITNDVMDISEQKPFLFIPQQLTAWIPKVDPGILEGVQKSYLEIECQISKGSGENVHYFVPTDGDGSQFGIIYVPFSADWKEGKRYVYTLCFGAGYDENGNEIDIVPITFDASVTNWVETPIDKNDF